MITFFTDLDNTLIYSYNHDIGQYKLNVELYQGREISFITKKTFEYLKELRERVLIVPTSTRTIEQYKRIDLGTGSFKYELCCNGGILLEDGKQNEDWYVDSLNMIKESLSQLNKGLEILEKDERRSFELRFIEDLFVFTKCNSPEEVVKDLKSKLDTEMVDIFNNGTKVYIVPAKLNKGAAVKRFLSYHPADYSISAGDSAFDISMLAVTDMSLAPYKFKDTYNVKLDLKECLEDMIFSDYLLEEILKKVKG